jgi:hypothetical protein
MPVGDGKVFDVAAQYRVKILSGGEKVCEVRWPTDAQWCDYARAHRTLQTSTGRGSTTQSLGDEDAAAELLRAIRVDEGGVEFDAADAVAVIDRLERAAVLECEREGAVYRVVLRVWGVETVHVLRMPTQRQMRTYEEGSTRRMGVGRGKQEIRGYLEPSGVLYGQLAAGAAEGYATVAPIVHQAAVLAEVLRDIALATESDDPE